MFFRSTQCRILSKGAKVHPLVLSPSPFFPVMFHSLSIFSPLPCYLPSLLGYVPLALRRPGTGWERFKFANGSAKRILRTPKKPPFLNTERKLHFSLIFAARHRNCIPITKHDTLAILRVAYTSCTAGSLPCSERDNRQDRQ